MWWPKWRLVLELKFSPREIDTWTLADILRANMALNLKNKAERQAYQAVK